MPIRHELRLSYPPPSVNEATKSVRLPNGSTRKVATDIYKSWMAVSQLELARFPGIGTDQGFWRLDVMINGSAGADLDNMEKGIIDCLRKAGKTPDDRYLVDLRFRFGDVSGVSIIIQREDPNVWARIRRVSDKLLAQMKRSYR